MSAPAPRDAASGGIDMSQFYRVFFDEAAEHLAEMERLLLKIDVAAPGAEDLNAIFRAAHSIKGGAGTFGFRDMAEVTHEAETLLDRVRKHETALTADMVDALLGAGDVLRAQLSRHRGESTDDVPADAAIARVRAFLDSATPTATHTAPTTPAKQARVLEIAIPPVKGKKAAAALATALAELRTLGRVQALKASSKHKRVRLTTTADDVEVKSLFGFAVDVDRIAIKAIGDSAAAEAPQAEVAESDPGYGFFDAPSAPETESKTDPGYGFFTETPAPAAQPDLPPRNWGRRATDHPDADGMRAGRRPTDKVVLSAAAEAASIRVSVEKVDLLINQVGELVITQAMLAQQIARLDPMAYQNLMNSMRDLERNTRDLQESVMSIRMLPMAFVFNRFPRMVRDLAAKLGKQVELVTVGEGTELDKGLIEKIADPLTHLVRNAIDHGIETTDKRRAASKPEKGTVILRAAHQGGNIVVEVSDDGAGLNRERILAKARDRGIAVSDAMTDQEVWQLIFEAGFSTADVVTDVSGRGVGMDVVKRNITELGGAVEIHSTAGQGTRMTVRLPLTLAIMDGMLIDVGGETYILPLGSVVESLQPSAAEIRTVSGRGRVIQVRSEFLPIVSLRELHGLPPQADDAKDIVVIVECEGGKTALRVDALLGQQQIVVKNLESNYRKVPGASGATILGDGTVALILDVPALVRRARH
jgi:two-component system chemotaxis sensor kinase CheA